MLVRPLAAALLATAALTIAACGGEDGAPAAERPSEADFERARLAFAECMREQGIDFPDPGSGEGGPVKIGGDATPEEMRAAEKACAKYREDIKPPELSEERKQEFKDAALRHARCMREHGIDFPDPTFSEDGGAQIRLGRGDVNPDDPDFKEAQEACEGELPSVREPQP